MHGLYHLLFAQPKTLTYVRDSGDEPKIAQLVGTTDDLSIKVNSTDEQDNLGISLKSTSQIDPAKVFYRSNEGIMTLSEIMAFDEIELGDCSAEPHENATALIPFVEKAFSSHFQHVELSHAYPGDNLIDRKDILDDTINKGFPYESDQAFWITSNIASNEYDYAIELTEGLLDEVEEVLSSIGIDASVIRTEEMEQKVIYKLQDLNTATTFDDMLSACGKVIISAPLPTAEEMKSVYLESANLQSELSARESIKQALAARGVPTTNRNVALVDEAMKNANYEGAWIQLTMFAVVEFSDFTNDDNIRKNQLTVERPYLWVGNLMMGSGIDTSETIDGSITLPRHIVHLDGKGAGYGIDEICGLYIHGMQTSKLTFTENADLPELHESPSNPLLG